MTTYDVDPVAEVVRAARAYASLPVGRAQARAGRTIMDAPPAVVGAAHERIAGIVEYLRRRVLPAQSYRWITAGRALEHLRPDDLEHLRSPTTAAVGGSAPPSEPVAPAPSHAGRVADPDAGRPTGEGGPSVDGGSRPRPPTKIATDDDERTDP